MAADRCQKRVTPGIEFLFRKPRPRRCRSDSSFSHDHRCLMFNTRLKRELTALREELSSLQQVKESLESEMLVLTLDLTARVQSVNPNFLGEMLYKSNDLIGRQIEDLVPAHVKADELHRRFKNALSRGEHFAGTVRLLRG